MRTRWPLPFLLAAVAHAQAVTLPPVLPQGGDTNQYEPWSTVDSGGHHQMLYGRSALAWLVAPVEITRLHFRSRDVVFAATVPQVTVRMSHAARPWNAPSATFAQNEGPDVTIVYAGSVQLKAQSSVSAGPGTSFVDIQLTTPFVYFPAMADLAIDIEWPSGSYSTGAIGRTESQGAATTQASHLWSLGAATSTAQYYRAIGAPVVAIDYNLPSGYAYPAAFGAGCYDTFATFYEAFVGGFDLDGGAGVRAIRAVPNAAGGYDVGVVPGSWFPPTSMPLANGAASVSLPFSFPYPGGATSQIGVRPSGYVWLASPGLDMAQPSVSVLLAQPARIAANWSGYAMMTGFPVPVGTGEVHFDLDPSTGHAIVSWLHMPYPTIVAPVVSSTFQLVLEPGGAFEVRYASCPASLNTRLVGWSLGGGARDPGNRDLSATMPFSTRRDQLPLRLRAETRPVLGTNPVLTTSLLPANAVFGAVAMSLTAVPAGIPLDPIGMAGCSQFVPTDSLMPFAPAAASVAWALPPNPAFAGLVVHAQSWILAPGVNALGAVVSNGLHLTLGVQ